MSWGWNSRPYVSAAKKRLRAQKATKALEKNGQKMNPVRIDGRSIARSFWGKAWCENLESYSDYANRLPRGRTYVRNGSVVDFVIAPGEINALVSGSDLYRITIKIQPVQKAEWKALKTDCAGRVGSLIDLLQGKLSAQVMEIITRRETGLFPRPAEIGLSCSCPDWAGMCKHVAATLYAVGARLDQNPELLFVLRGADHLELVTEATESVTIGVSSSLDGSATLTGENLEEIFGIEIEPDVLPGRDESAKRRVGGSASGERRIGETACRRVGERGETRRRNGEIGGSATGRDVSAKRRVGGSATGRDESAKRRVGGSVTGETGRRNGVSACRRPGETNRRNGVSAGRRRGETSRRNGVSAGRRRGETSRRNGVSAGRRPGETNRRNGVLANKALSVDRYFFLALRCQIVIVLARTSHPLSRVSVVPFLATPQQKSRTRTSSRTRTISEQGGRFNLRNLWF